MYHNTFCQKCKLWATCKHPCIEGRGNPYAPLLFIGEAPGREEDEQGTVFIGSAGQKLQLHLHSCNVPYFITNAVKCRPVTITEEGGRKKVENRTPTTKEVLFCAPKTYEIIDRMKPQVIVTLGSTPTHQLLKISQGMEMIRGKVFYHPSFECFVIPTWHPAFLLYNQDKKIEAEFQQDIRQAIALLDKPKVRRICSKPKSLSDPASIKEYLNKLKTAEVFSCDIETTGKAKGDGLNPRKGRITDISFCMKPGEGVHIKWSDILPFFDDLKEALENPNSKKVGHNFRFDMKFLRKIGIDVQNFYFDTMLAYHTLTMTFEGKGQSLYSLETMSWLLTYEGDYKSILEEFGGIAKHQETVESDNSSEGVTNKELNKKIEKKKKEIPVAITKPEPPSNTAPTFFGNPLILHTEEGISQDIISARFAHLESQEKDLSLLNSFVPKVRTAPKPKAPTFVINEELEKTLQKYASFTRDKLKERLEKYNLTPLQFYSAMDADVTLQIYYKLKPEIDKYFAFVFYELIMPLSRTLLRLEENGVLLDQDLMNKVYEENAQEIEQIKKDLYKKVGFEFNIDSPTELRNVIYHHLKVKPNPKFMTSGGKGGTKLPSTNKEAIEFLSNTYPELKPIVRYREIAKQNSTSIIGFKKLLDEETGRIYGQFLQHTTATGRLSSANPNLQNIPRDTRIRHMFIPSLGHKFITCDLSQAELRILAMVSGDPKMLEAFAAGHDFHTYTACKMFKIKLEEFSKSNPEHARARNISKNINFGVAYQMTAMALADDLGITLEEAQKFIDTFYSTYKDVKLWVDDTMRFARKHGYVETVHGRRRYLPHVYSSQEDLKSRALRQAVNTPIQGTASDCAAFGLIKLQQYLDQNHMKAKPVMIIHDEIVVDTPEDEVEKVSEVLPIFMTKDIPKITIPLVADLHVLDRWEK